MRRLKEVSVRHKVIGASVIYVALCVALGAFFLDQAQRINARAQEIRSNWLPSTVRLGHLAQALGDLRLHQFGLTVHLAVDYAKLDEYERLINEASAKVQSTYEANKPYIIPGSIDAQLMGEFAIKLGKLQDATRRGLGLARAGDIYGAIALFENEAKDVLLAAQDLVRRDLHFKETEGAKAADRGASVYALALNLVIVAILAAVALGVFISIALNRSIVSPLARSTRVVSALTAGDVEVRVEDAGRRDEFGTLARALEFFRNTLLEARRKAIEVEEERRRAEEEHRRAQAAAIAEERALVSASIGAGMARLADKDLSFRITDKLPEAYAKLQSDFNHAMEQLEGAMGAITRSIGTIASSTREVSSSSDDLSRRTEQQAASLEETAAALDEITATGKRAAEGADHARDVVKTAKQDAETTGEVVRRTVDAMSGIQKSAQQITQIIGVIDEIAFQTNLLALNAGVEAARAGDAGRGFAVVASEVRALAQRSAQAAREIKGLISTSGAQVEQGVALVARTGAALHHILEQVNDINTVVIDIAAGAQEQATGLAEINTAINQMDRTTQQNAAMVEETTAASHALAQESRQLAYLVGQFRVSTGDEAQPAPRSATSRAPVAQLKHRAARRGPAAVAPATSDPAAEDSDWAEF